MFTVQMNNGIHDQTTKNKLAYCHKIPLSELFPRLNVAVIHYILLAFAA